MIRVQSEFEPDPLEKEKAGRQPEENEKKEVGRKRQVHASSMRARSFFEAEDDEAMRTGRI